MSFSNYRPNLYREVHIGSNVSSIPIAYIMLNPSHAKQYEQDRNTDNDKTIINLIKITEYNGFASFFVVNLFSYISPKKSDLTKVDDPIGPNNDNEIITACEKAQKIIVAWGRYENRLIKERAKIVLSMLSGKELFCLGINTDNSPRHPGRIPHQTTFIPFSP